MQEIGEKLIRFGEELLDLAGRRGAGEVAEEGLEKAARETTEATAERSAREGADDPARKAAELPQAIAAARGISEANDAVDTPTPALIGILNSSLRGRYPWIKNFEARPKGRPGHYLIHMIASDHEVDPDYSTERTNGDLPQALADLDEGELNQLADTVSIHQTPSLSY